MSYEIEGNRDEERLRRENAELRREIDGLFRQIIETAQEEETFSAALLAQLFDFLQGMNTRLGLLEERIDRLEKRRT